ncbi:peptidoglycan DD-transpeptidase MrdA [Pantoea sp. Aalb]|uniref:peptidoglycan DD-transpeptidase MrdA n=1 Tax=Pantoea sp. Aalb TaxID=2576762 RepID=UPI00132703AA|nr:peptidoglycan DD-transpeptidase MrdA [Pantoea sp. Aalb]MXP67552.1 peptidoglycan DD-transpeptidase MrdA [Pantoea sp. Aalb]
MILQKNIFRDYSAEQKIYIKRAFFAFMAILVVFIMLIINSYKLQILFFDQYNIKSNENRIRIMPIEPSRGIIFDRNGIPLAVNQTIYTLELIPEKIFNFKKMLHNLRLLLNFNDNDINFVKNQYQFFHYLASIPIKNYLNDIQVARFAINQHFLSGLEIKCYQRRYYPYGKTLTHILGYVSKINDLDEIRLIKEGKWQNYTNTYDIGKLGIESYYEDLLHGKIGYEEVEVNSHGNIIRNLHKQSPQAGQDIYLTVDLKLQQFIEKLLVGNRAAAVVTDPRTGEILALVSTPSYNPNLFVEGISNSDYSILLNNENQPLYNRTIQATYPPASTVKPYIAISALTSGIINSNTNLFDPGWWRLPDSKKRYRDWKKLGHNRLDITKSLEESADTFFYQIAYDMGINRLSKWMTKFGYGHRTGIDLPQENVGNMPTRDWKMQRFNTPWYQGDTISMGIGQGYWSATPLQMNKAIMILINNGVIKVPHLLHAMRKKQSMVYYCQPPIKPIDHIYSNAWKIVKNGMYGVANRLNGTARKSFADAPYKIAAKSGTAQIFGLKEHEIYNVNKITERLRDHKLMTAFAPYNKPRVAITMILENGGNKLHSNIGNITRQILDHIMIKSINSSPIININKNFHERKK